MEWVLRGLWYEGPRNSLLGFCRKEEKKHLLLHHLCILVRSKVRSCARVTLSAEHYYWISNDCKLMQCRCRSILFLREWTTAWSMRSRHYETTR
jgi:hypothetical protein